MAEQVVVEVTAVDEATAAVQEIEQETQAALQGIEAEWDNAAGGPASYADAIDESMATAREAEEETAGITDRIGDNWLAISAGMGAAGAGVEAFNQKMQDTDHIIKQLGDSTEMQAGEIQGLAGELSNATLSYDEIIQMMEIGRQRGLESREELEEFVLQWDQVGDATQGNAVALADASTALQTMDVAADETAESFDALGYIHRDTTNDAQGFMRIMERAAMYMDDWEMSVDEGAAAMGALEHEVGIAGRAARRQFNQAIRQSEDGLGDFIDELGLTTEEFEKHLEKVEEGEEVIESSSQHYADTRTVMQELRATAEGLAGQLSGIAREVGGFLTPIMMGLVPAIKGISSIAGPLAGKIKALAASKGILTGATTALTAAKSALLGVLAALSAPFIAIPALVAAVVAGIVIFREEIAAVGGFIRDTLLGAFESLMTVIGGLAAVFGVDLLDPIASVLDMFGLLGERGKESRYQMTELRRSIRNVRDTITGLGDAIVGVVTTAFEYWRDVLLEIPGHIANLLSSIDALIPAMIQAFSSAIAVIGDLPSMARDALTGLGDTLKTMLTEGVSAAISGFRESFEGLVGYMTEVPGRVINYVQEIPGAFMEVFEEVMPNLHGIVTSGFEELVGIVSGIAGPIVDAVGELGSNMLTALQSRLAGVTEVIRGIFGGALSFIGGLPQEISGMARNIAESIRDPIAQYIPDVPVIFEDGFSGAIDYLQGIPRKFYEMGVNMIESLVDGLLDNVRGAVSSVRSSVDSMVDAARSAIGMSSPAEEFINIGESMGEGIEVGVEATERDLVSAGRGATEAARSGAASQNGGRTGGATNITQNVNIESPEPLDERGVRKENKKLMQKLALQYETGR